MNSFACELHSDELSLNCLIEEMLLDETFMMEYLDWSNNLDKEAW